jgi:predicted RNA-binding protein with TRAM domain
MVHRRVRGGKYKMNYTGQPAPVEVGDELEVNITTMHPSGAGVTSIREYTIVVPKAKPGDSVKIRVISVNGKNVTAEIIPDSS